MSGGVPLFEVNPALDRAALADRFRRERRIQVRDVLTDATAREVHRILSNRTPWGVAWRAGKDGPHMLRRDAMQGLSREENQAIGQKLMQAMRGSDYAFVYSAFPILTGYQEGWDPGGPHDLLIEHINAEPFMALVREITGIPELVKADAQATLYQPSHFLARHDDGDVEEGRRIAYVLNFTLEEWRPEWGGYLHFFDAEGDVIAGYKPRFNALNMFEVPQPHEVSYVPPFAPAGRYAITGWFRDF